MAGRIYSYSDFIVHEIEGYIGKIHIIEYEDRLLMIDSGCINDIRRMENYCETAMQRTLADVKLIILSHLHPDHSGGAVKLRKTYSIPLAAHRDLDKWYAGFGGALQHKVDSYLATVVAFRNKRRLEKILYKRMISPDYPLIDKDVLPFFPDWQVLHVPGHTLYDLVVYNAKEGLLFINDLICDVKGKPQLPIPVLFPDKMSASFTRLSQLKVKNIFRTHGAPIITENPAEAFVVMQDILANAPTPLARRINYISVFPAVARKELKKESKKALFKNKIFKNS